jgi:DNA-binding winged helix-turn-helix (wHTH) protein/tetratricopeptide (TPR) repeat protein
VALTGGVVEFGPFRLDGSRLLLWRREELVAVTPKALELLAVLVEQQGQVVAKSELLERVWPDTFVEEANLSVNVSALRKALGSQEDGRPYIETVSRRGYRFVGKAQAVASAIRVLAVLPFLPLEPGHGDETLGVGMADALITRLGRVGQVVVRPTAAVLKYAAAPPDLREIGRELKVDAVLSGRIQKAGDRIRVTVQLVETAEGSTAWADGVDAKAAEIFDLEDAIAERLAAALTLRLSAGDRARLTRQGTRNADAYRAYLRGRYLWNKLTGLWLERAREAFEEAIGRDPDFALAHAGLADALTLLVFYGLAPGKEVWPRARAAAERALALDPELAEAHVSLAYARLFGEWGWREADAGLRRAVELSPASAVVRQWRALYLGMVGDFPGALAEIQRALELDPLSLTIGTNAGFQAYLAGQLEGEVEQHLRLLELEPDYALGHWGLGLAYEQKGMYEEAVAAARRAVSLSGGSDLIKANLGRACALAGRTQEARELLGELEARGVSPYRLATVRLALGEKESALSDLERACRERDHWMVWLKVDPMLESLRSEEVFDDLVDRVGFP